MGDSSSSWALLGLDCPSWPVRLRESGAGRKGKEGKAEYGKCLLCSAPAGEFMLWSAVWSFTRSPSAELFSKSDILKWRYNVIM